MVCSVSGSPFSFIFSTCYIAYERKVRLYGTSTRSNHEPLTFNYSSEQYVYIMHNISFSRLTVPERLLIFNR
jgi:hypothetical protein